MLCEAEGAQDARVRAGKVLRSLGCEDTEVRTPCTGVQDWVNEDAYTKGGQVRLASALIAQSSAIRRVAEVTCHTRYTLGITLCHTPAQ